MSRGRLPRWESTPIALAHARINCSIEAMAMYPSKVYSYWRYAMSRACTEPCGSSGGPTGHAMQDTIAGSNLLRFVYSCLEEIRQACQLKANASRPGTQTRDLVLYPGRGDVLHDSYDRASYREHGSPKLPHAQSQTSAAVEYWQAKKKPESSRVLCRRVSTVGRGLLCGLAICVLRQQVRGCLPGTGKWDSRRSRRYLSVAGSAQEG